MRVHSSNSNAPFWPTILLASLLPLVAAGAPKPLREMTLQDENGKPVKLASLKKDGDVLVLVFVASTCPVTSLYWERIKGAWYNYRDRGVAMAAVGGNSDDDMEKIKTTLKERDMELLLLWDQGHALARSLDVKHTPVAVVISPNWEVFYRGRMDDSWRDESRVKQRNLDDAITAAMSGRKTTDRMDEPFMGSRMR
ncbi:MAG: redoxin domain-containing protein [Verrucomicrobia bacterium]|nr:redoxin domain-containing protein [Verrucomicrobiota bacterium]